MNYYIITGTTRGVGEALALNALQAGNTVIALSRSSNARLGQAASRADHLHEIAIDLATINDVQTIAQKAFKFVREDAKAVYLINNAGIINPVKRAADLTMQEISTTYNTNVVSLMALTATFIKTFQDRPIQKRIVNLSSGAGKRPFEGWSVYCGTKAAVDIFSQTVALEQDRMPNKIEITAFAPGIVDTGMQVEIRSSDLNAFPMLDDFKGFKENGNLLAPSYVAEIIDKVLQLNSFPHGELVRVNDYD